jgi:ParB/RepB/Spo0J family partition protein
MPLKQLTVDASLLRPNPWNTNVVSPENELKIEESIKRFKALGGMFKPVIVRELPGGTYEILGGEHRWRAAVKLGYTEIPVANVGTVSDETAQEIGLVDNGRYGEDDVLRLAELMKGLGDVDELQSFLPMSSDDLASIFAASTIALDDLDALDKGEVPEAGSGKAEATHQIMRFKVPVADVAKVQALIEKTMRVQGFLTEDSLTNAGNALVHILITERPE